MNKNRLLNVLISFYTWLEQNNKINSESNLTHKDFIVIGGSSLVLQDRISQTKDIDLITSTTSLDSLERFLRTNGISAGIHMNHAEFITEIVFDFSGEEFDILQYLNFSDYESSVKLTLNNTNIYVRPTELIIDDYEKIVAYIRGYEKEYPHMDTKLEKWEDRIKLLAS